MPSNLSQSQTCHILYFVYKSPLYRIEESRTSELTHPLQRFFHLERISCITAAGLGDGRRTHHDAGVGCLWIVGGGGGSTSVTAIVTAAAMATRARDSLACCCLGDGTKDSLVNVGEGGGALRFNDREELSPDCSMERTFPL